MDTPANPIIIETDANKGNRPSVYRGLGIALPKILFLVLILVIVVEIIIGISALTRPVPIQSVKIAEPSNSAIVLQLPSKKTSFKVGETISVAVWLDTGGVTSSAVDVVIKYDPKVLAASGSASIIQGGIFNEYPFKSVDEKNGSIQISAISTIPNRNFNGINEFAILNLKAVNPGSTKLKVQYTPNSTDDSNIIKENTTEDVLAEIRDISLTITP